PLPGLAPHFPQPCQPFAGRSLLAIEQVFDLAPAIGLAYPRLVGIIEIGLLRQDRAAMTIMLGHFSSPVWSVLHEDNTHAPLRFARKKEVIDQLRSPGSTSRSDGASSSPPTQPAGRLRLV